jgi:hypothetical protein
MKSDCASQTRRPREQGFFLVIVMLIMASIMMIYVAANSRRLANVRKEIRLVEQQQVQRLNRSTNVTTLNIPAPAVTSPAAP